MTEDVIPFSNAFYKKFEHPLMCTIRRRDKYGYVGDKKTIEPKNGPNKEVMIVGKEKKKLKNIPTRFLLYDTSTPEPLSNRKEAKDYINQFYRKPLKPNEELIIYFLLKT